METRVINEYQKEKYSVSPDSNKEKLSRITGALDAVAERDCVRVLDIGGGDGQFARLVYDYLRDKTAVEVYVVDSVTYSGSNDHIGGVNIQFYEETAMNIDRLFEKGFFDIVLTINFLHHLVCDTWKETRLCQSLLLQKIRGVMKSDGYLCVVEQPAESYIKDGAASFIIYKLTSCKNKAVASICKRLDAKSAGVGVCFLSERLWMKALADNGFSPIGKKDGVRRKLKWYMRLFLLLKDYHFDVGYMFKQSRE